MQTTSGVAARNHGRKIMARKIAAAAAGDRGELLEDSCLAPSFGDAGLGDTEGRTMIYEVSKDPYL